jgi:AraC-like DNA-binding protein
MPDAAFNRAFKRKFDTTPGAARRDAPPAPETFDREGQ